MYCKQYYLLHGYKVAGIGRSLPGTASFALPSASLYFYIILPPTSFCSSACEWLDVPVFAGMVFMPYKLSPVDCYRHQVIERHTNRQAGGNSSEED